MPRFIPLNSTGLATTRTSALIPVDDRDRIHLRDVVWKWILIRFGQR
jgi:hypothetical protein